MSLFLILAIVVLGPVLLLFLLIGFWGIGLGSDWLAERLSPRAKEEPDGTPVEMVDREILQLAERIVAQERDGGSGTWLAQIVLWRNRRRLSELQHRRAALIEREKRIEARTKGVRLPGTLPARPMAVQPPSISGDGIKFSG